MQHRNDYTHHHYVFTCNFEEQNIPFTPIFRHIWTRCAFVDIFEFAKKKPSMSASECQCCSDWAVSWNLVGSISSAYGVVMRRLLRMQLFCHRWRRGNPQCTVCRWCTTGVRGGRCLSQFQICVCVSGLVRLLSVSKFSLCQSASTVTKSLRSPAGASCQSVKKTRTAVCSYIEQPRESCTETQQRF